MHAHGMKRGWYIILVCCGFLMAGAQVALDPNIAQYGVGKTRHFIQSGPVTVTPVSHTFRAFVEAGPDGVINRARVSGPLGSHLDVNGPQSLILYSGGAVFESTTYLNQGSLDTDFPSGSSGNYGLRIDTGVEGGSTAGGYDHAVMLNLGSDAYPAATPALTFGNSLWSDGRLITDVRNPAVLSWNFADYIAATDIILLSIRPQAGGSNVVDLRFADSDPGGFTIEAGWFTAGQNYVGRLTFLRVVDRPTDIPGADGLAFFATETTFNFAAVPEPSSQSLIALGAAVVAWSVWRRRQRR